MYICFYFCNTGGQGFKIEASVVILSTLCLFCNIGGQNRRECGDFTHYYKCGGEFIGYRVVSPTRLERSSMDRKTHVVVKLSEVILIKIF